MTTTTRVAVGLGSNVGERTDHIEGALEALARLGELVAVSSLYETAPIGGPDQGPYLNAVAVLDTALEPEELLAACLAIEQGRGRQRRVRWGPRTLDLDILIFGDVVLDKPGLTIPHPRLLERRFVVEPLLEVWPEVELPDGTRVAAMLPAVAGQQVRRLRRPVSATVRSATIFVVTGVAAVIVWWLIGFLL